MSLWISKVFQLLRKCLCFEYKFKIDDSRTPVKILGEKDYWKPELAAIFSLKLHLIPTSVLLQMLL